MKNYRFIILRLMLLISLLTVPLFFSPTHSVYAATIRFAKPGGVTSGSCSSWATACELRYALGSAASGDEIWAQAGTYKPTNGTDRTISFVLKSNVALYGGFNGTETTRNQRNWVTNLTILSGDIGTPGDATDNTYHVVYYRDFIGSTTVPVLDGFTISHGAGLVNDGGGILLDNSSASLSNLTISNNTASYGGGIHIIGATTMTTLTHITLSDNTAINFGGGIFAASSAVTLTDLTITNNTATHGGGMYLNTNLASLTNLTNLTVSNNTATYGGGMFLYYSPSTLTNLTLSNNTAFVGGGVYLGNSNPTLTNVTFSGNSATGSGGGMRLNSSTATIRNSILWGNTSPNGAGINGAGATVIYSLIQGMSPDPANHNLDGATDPLFVNAASGDLHLQVSSPARNIGNNTVTNPALPLTDRDGNPRIIGTTVDLGSYESLVIRYVHSGAIGTNDGSSWENAYTDLQSALAVAQDGYEIWVAKGTYKPTNVTPVTASEREISFTLVNGVGVYGGFLGGETTRSQRSLATNKTILSGDIDTTGANDSYHIVYGSSLGASTVLDGFTISGGKANGPGLDADGGGIYLNSSAATLSNLILSSNNAANAGGGMSLSNSSATLVNLEPIRKIKRG